MSTASFGDTIRQLTQPMFGRRLDYRQKLEKKLDVADQDAPDVSALSEDDETFAMQMRDLAEREQLGGVAFQSVAVAALQVLDRICCSEKQVAQAAISLGQRAALEEMVAGLEATSEAIREMLSDQGEKMHDLSAPCTLPDTPPSWWFALSEAIETLDDGIDCMTSLVANQPKGGATRTLTSIVARQLRRHHHVLLHEAGTWMT